MKNNLPLEEVIQKDWRVRKVRSMTDRYPEWVIEYMDDPKDKHTEWVIVATVCGPQELAMAFRALPQFVTAASLTAFRIHTVLEAAKAVLEGHRAGLKEAKKMLLDVLEQAGLVETLKVLKKISA